VNRRSWKRVESKVAQVLGGRRIPCPGRAGPDVAHPWLAVEVKSRVKVPAYLRTWLRQARAGADPAKLPIVVLHESGTAHGDDLVILALADFRAWFGG
jgi:hypothetical protein